MAKPEKPKKPKAKATKPVEAAKPKAQVARRMITEGQLTSLLRGCTGMKKQTDELTGALREKIAYAVEKQHLHKKAFATVRQLDRMEPEKLAEYWDHLLAYMDMAGVMTRIESVGHLPLGKDDGADEGDEPAGAKPPQPDGNGKVSRPKFGEAQPRGGGEGRDLRPDNLRQPGAGSDPVSKIAANAGASVARA